ncbi:MAG: excinuclease ABC subunit UvrC [Pseudoscardovia radai]|nr:excinuclease ABC subunit UvrC [Pseudoscardovia radai]
MIFERHSPQVWHEQAERLMKGGADAGHGADGAVPCLPPDAPRGGDTPGNDAGRGPAALPPASESAAPQSLTPQTSTAQPSAPQPSPSPFRKTRPAADAAASDAAGQRGVNKNGAPLLGDTRDLFRPKPSDIPRQPGVYKWRDGDGRVIYVGKAKNLHNRLSNYFQPLERLHPRTQTMVLTARSLEWTVVSNELESLTLEYTWIKEFDPRFNVVFRDDKTYPYLAVSVGEDYPRVWFTRSRTRRGTRYFGPYVKVWDVRNTLDSLLATYPVRTCSPGVFHKAQVSHRPCLLASIGKCSAPCVGRIGVAEHRRMVERIVGIMTGRLGKSYIAELTQEMKQASDDLEFEKAARLRDQIQMMRNSIQSNAVVFDSDVDADVFGISSDELEASVHAFFVRAGTIRGERNWSVERVEDVSDAELMADLITQVYSSLMDEDSRERSVIAPTDTISVTTSRDAVAPSQQASAVDAQSRARTTRERHEREEMTGRDDLMSPMSPVPREILLPIEPERREELEGWLSDLRGSAVTIRVPQRGEKRDLMEKATANAVQALQRSKLSRIKDMGARTEAMNDVAAALGLDQAPLRIECYDISNASGGGYQVASMVVFEDAVAKKSEYRRFAIRGKDGRGAVDDTSAIYETLTRRFRHGNIAGDTGEDMDSERRLQVSRAREAADGAADGAPESPNGAVIEAAASANGSLAPGVSAASVSAPDGTEARLDGRTTVSAADMDVVIQQNADLRHFAYKPNLVVVDGGYPQVRAAQRALDDCGVTDVAVCGLAKKLEEVWVPDDDYPIIMKRQSEGMYLLQRVRDESHRFAITYHRQTRRKGALRSALDGIEGIGPAYQKKLLAHFGSVKAIRAAGPEDLEDVDGIGAKKARRIYDALHPSGAAPSSE